MKQRIEEKCQIIHAKKKLGQKLSQRAPANSFKKTIQKSKQQPQKRGGRFSVRPIFGASAACGASDVVLKFVSVIEGICRSFWLSFWPSFFLGLDYLTSLFDFFDIFVGEKIVKPTKIIFGQIDFSKIGSCKNDFSQNRIFQNRILFLSVFPKPNLSKKSANFAKCFLNIQVSSKVFAGVQGLPAPHSLGLPGRQPPHIYGMV